MEKEVTGQFKSASKSGLLTSTKTSTSIKTAIRFRQSQVDFPRDKFKFNNVLTPMKTNKQNPVKVTTCRKKKNNK